MLEIIITIAAIGLIIWGFLRHNTMSGKRAVGAHVFLTALDDGKGLEAARDEAAAASEQPTKTIIHRTYERIQRDHQGKSAKLIKTAEARGFRG